MGVNREYLKYDYCSHYKISTDAPERLIDFVSDALSIEQKCHTDRVSFWFCYGPGLRDNVHVGYTRFGTDFRRAGWEEKKFEIEEQSPENALQKYGEWLIDVSHATGEWGNMYYGGRLYNGQKWWDDK